MAEHTRQYVFTLELGDYVTIKETPLTNALSFGDVKGSLLGFC